MSAAYGDFRPLSQSVILRENAWALADATYRRLSSPPAPRRMPEPIIVIPARKAAERLPGKPLLDIRGTPLVVHVWRRAREAGLGPVLVATDRPEIVRLLETAGGAPILTSHKHQSGSDRVF